MDDLISRSALLDICEQQGHVDVDDLVNALAVDPVRWIPVEERLPEIGERVLTLSKWGHVSDRELRKYLSGGIYFWPDGLNPGVDVKYWMPLPDAPKEEPER